MRSGAEKIISRTPGWRAALGALAVALTVLAAAALTYQLALADIPAHRATLENLVHARTGFDVRFDELGLRWGWYGPEAVFSRVELREPGAPEVLVRAPELTVGVDAWRTLQSGQLEAGRITLVAPDIDITRLEPSSRGHGAAISSARSEPWSTGSLLAHWPNGRMDIEGGTLRLPDPAGSERSLSMSIRRATLRHTDDLWSAQAHALLPERLGRDLRLSLQLRTDSRDAPGIGGVVHIEAERLILAGWRELIQRRWSGSQDLPSAGEGRIAADLQLRGGRIESGHGSVRVEDVILRPAAPGVFPDELHLESVRGVWQLSHAPGSWHFAAEDLTLGARVPGRPPGHLALDVAENGQWIRASLRRTPLESRLDEGWRGVSGQLSALSGSVRELSLDWAAARGLGARLHLESSIDDLSIATHAEAPALTSASVHLLLTDSRVSADIQSPRGRLTLTGSLRPETKASASVLTLHASLIDTDVAVVQALVGDRLQEIIGARAPHLSSGSIKHAEFAWIGSWGGGSQARASSGSATLRDATLEAEQDWPDVSRLDAQLEWHGTEWRANIGRASAGPFEILALKAAWRSDQAGGLRCSGQAEGRIENVLEWLRRQRQLEAASLTQGDFAARGTARFTLDALVPRAAKPGEGQPRLRVSAQLEGATLALAPQIPALEDVHGTLMLDAGHLQRSLLAAHWLGGPLTLRVSERRAGEHWGLNVQAQGTLDAGQLARAAATDLGTLEVAGRTGWRGDFTLTPGGTGPASWHAQADTTLAGITSRMPAPLAKEARLAVPLHVDLQGAANDALARLSLADTLRGVLALHQDEHGWRATGGALGFGGEPAAEAPAGTIEVHGDLAHVDLAPWIIAWRGFAQSALGLPLSTHLQVETLSLAGHAYGSVAVTAQQRDGALQLALHGASLEGALMWPAHPSSATPVEARFEALQIPGFGAAVDVAPLIAALGPVAELEVDRLGQEERLLGRLHSRLEIEGREITIDPLTLEGATDDLRAAMHCGSAGPCRLRFALDTRDAASTLRDFGLRADFKAEHGSLSGELDWPLAAAQSSPNQWLSSLRGDLRLALTDGSVSGRADTGSPFALMTVPALLQAAPASLGRELKFAQVNAVYDLHDGSAYTSDLHFDGDAEILMSGRIGLVDEDYDSHALILRGEDRLPAAVRESAAAPKVAAAWMALRELFSQTEPDPSRLQLRLRGSWQSPAITAAR
jgi:uncharacterized protein YhdP